MAGTDQITQRRNGSLFCPCGVTFACVGCAALSKLRPFSLATLSSTAAVVAVGVSASSSWKCAKLRPLENMESESDTIKTYVLCSKAVTVRVSRVEIGSEREEIGQIGTEVLQLSFLGQKTRGLESKVLKDHTLKG